jgi:hypothetical protein
MFWSRSHSCDLIGQQYGEVTSFTAEGAASDLVNFYPGHTLAAIALRTHNANVPLRSPETLVCQVALRKHSSCIKETDAAQVPYSPWKASTTVENATK